MLGSSPGWPRAAMGGRSPRWCARSRAADGRLIIWRDPRAAYAGRLAHRRAARAVGRDGAGAVSQSARRSLPVRLGVGRGRWASCWCWRPRRSAVTWSAWRPRTPSPASGWSAPPSPARLLGVLLTLCAGARRAGDDAAAAGGRRRRLRARGRQRPLTSSRRPSAAGKQAFMLGSTGFLGWSSCAFMGLGFAVTLPAGAGARPRRADARRRRPPSASASRWRRSGSPSLPRSRSRPASRSRRPA